MTFGLSFKMSHEETYGADMSFLLYENKKLDVHLAISVLYQTYVAKKHGILLTILN